MKKYMYCVTDSAGTFCGIKFTRESARISKRRYEASASVELFGDKPPYKIVRYELVNPKVVR